MADFKMTDYETADKYVYDTIEELIATENKGLVLKKFSWPQTWSFVGREFDNFLCSLRL